MSHYYVKYDTTRPGAARKACLDALQYMGRRPYRRIARAIQAHDPEGIVRLAASMVGVEGYPVTAMLERYRR